MWITLVLLFLMIIRIDLKLSIFQHQKKMRVSAPIQIDRRIRPSNQIANHEMVILQFCKG